MKRLAIPLAALLATVLSATPVSAGAKPPNDLPSGAIAVVDSLPQTVSQTTTGATVGRKDDVGCGAGGVDQATVWYTFTPTADESVLVDASASSYEVGVNVFESVADPDHLVNCSSGALIFDASAGTTYYLMFADIDGDATNGGTLTFTVDHAPPPLGVTLTVNPTATLSGNGSVATISGTITCSGTADFAEVDGFLTQTLGRFKVVGSGSTEPTCGPTPEAWSMDVTGETGRFGGGNIDAQVSAFACDALTCGDAFVEAAVKGKH